MSDAFRDRFEQSRNTPAGPPLEVVGELLRSYVADSEPEETRRAIEELARDGSSPFLPRALEALEALLAAPPREQELIDLVEWQGGKVLEEPRGESAREFLAGLAGLVRSALEAGR